MLNIFKKNTVTHESTIPSVSEEINKDIIESSEQPEITSDFPTAKEMCNTSSKHWPLLDEKEILEKITKLANRGERHTAFYNSLISSETKEKLESLGYTINISELDGVPFFKIYW